MMVKAFLAELSAANKDANIIIITHVKGIEGEDKVIKYYMPELVGRGLDESWASRFNAVMGMSKVVIGKGAKFNLLTEKTKLWPFIMIRAGAGNPPPDNIDITVTDPKDFTPLQNAWDTIFNLLA